LVMELTAYHTKLAYYKIIYIASDFWSVTGCYEVCIESSYCDM
jgi:hypothetical protein